MTAAMLEVGRAELPETVKVQVETVAWKTTGQQIGRQVSGSSGKSLSISQTLICEKGPRLA